MNVYSKLLNISGTLLDINELVDINLKDHTADIYTEANKSKYKSKTIIMKVDNEIEDSDLEEVNAMVIKVLRECNFNLNEYINKSFVMPLQLFINVRDHLIEEMKRNKDKLEKYIYDNFINIPNKEVQNKEYYDSFLGYKFIDDCSDNYKRKVLNIFKKARKDRVKELHYVVESYSRLKNIYSNIERMDYYSDMGLGYMYKCETNLGNNDLEFDKKLIMKPLPRINMDYCKNKIHVLEVELCYINSNIKAINKILSSNKKKED